MMQKNKTYNRAQVDPLKVIMLAVILIVVVVVILVVFRGIFGKQASGLEDTVGGLKDYDKDGRADLLDPCPCDSEREPPCSTSEEVCNDLRSGKE